MLKDIGRADSVVTVPKIAARPGHSGWKIFKGLVRNICISVCSNMVAEEGAVFLHHLTSTRLYGKVPYFTSQLRSAHPIEWDSLKDWMKGNAILQLGAGGLLLGASFFLSLRRLLFI
jgi:hypothetical protein